MSSSELRSAQQTVDRKTKYLLFRSDHNMEFLGDRNWTRDGHMLILHMVAVKNVNYDGVYPASNRAANEGESKGYLLDIGDGTPQCHFKILTADHNLASIIYDEVLGEYERLGKTEAANFLSKKDRKLVAGGRL